MPYGAERFISTCAEIGVDGLILPDLPFEEKEEFLPLCRQYGVDLISMIAPHLGKPHCHDCQRGRGIFVRCVQSRRDRHPQ